MLSCGEHDGAVRPGPHCQAGAGLRTGLRRDPTLDPAQVRHRGPFPAHPPLANDKTADEADTLERTSALCFEPEGRREGYSASEAADARTATADSQGRIRGGVVRCAAGSRSIFSAKCGLRIVPAKAGWSTRRPVWERRAPPSSAQFWKHGRRGVGRAFGTACTLGHAASRNLPIPHSRSSNLSPALGLNWDVSTRTGDTTATVRRRQKQRLTDSSRHDAREPRAATLVSGCGRQVRFVACCCLRRVA